MYFIQRKKIYTVLFIAFVAAAALTSCQKKEIDFGGNVLSDDPNVVTIDTISVNAFTAQLDSFSTLSTGYFIAGKHYDSTFGNFQSTAYFDVNIPYDSSGILANCTSCYYDSLVAAPEFSGGYYGDTTQLFTLNINQLSGTIADAGSFGYNTNSIKYNSNAIGSFSAVVQPSKQNITHIKLSDEIGKDLFAKMQRKSDTITESDKFLDYIKGFCFTTSATNNAVYYMKPVSDSNLIMLYYHKNASLPANYVVKLPLNTAHQFNGFATAYMGTNLAAFIQKKAQTLTSAQTGGNVYLHANQGLYPKFNFPSLYSLNEINAYVNVLSATLEIYPLKGSYGTSSFYTLPPALNLYIMNEYDETEGTVAYTGTSTLQTGDLYIDHLYNENTKYSFDVTSYIKSALAQGKYSALYLYLQLPAGAAQSNEERLVLQALNNNSFKLKLNVLGL